MNVRQRHRSVRLAWAPSRTRRIIRHRLFQAGVLAVVGALAGQLLHSQSVAVAQAQQQWGELQAVFVVATPVAQGAFVVPAVERQDVPLAMVPAGAAAQIDPSQRARTALFAGEIVLSERLTGTSSTASARGMAALTVSVLAQPPTLTEGDLVDLWQVDGTTNASVRAMRNVTVLAFDSNEVTVAVPTHQLPEATAASVRPLILTVTG